MKKLKRVLYPICIIVLLFAVWNLWKIKTSTEHAKKLYTSLAQQAASGQAEEDSNQSGVSEETGENRWLQDLQKQNPDLIGWITIPGTAIDYPVMQTTPDQDDYYLSHDFNRKENDHGTPFLDVNCQVAASDNLIIYGHHMKDGTMFQNLMLYKDPDFCKSNGTIRFSMPGETRKYSVIFVLRISEEEAEKFPYYRCIDLSDPEIYNGFLKQCSRYAIWQADTLPQPGTKLLTLSTCEYSQENGRLVVVAKQET